MAGDAFDESAVLAGRRLFDQFAFYPRTVVDQLDPQLFLMHLRSPGVSDSVLTGRRALERGWQSAIEDARALAETSDGRAELRTGARAPAARLPVAAVYQAALYQAVKCGMNASDPRHARDFFHLVVPISCCDLVVLDANGRERARQIQVELRRKTRLTFAATVQSGLADAITWLEAA
jgi:hypothetical protein